MLFAALDFLDYVYIAAIVAAFTSGAVILRPGDRARLRRLEGKLDLLLRHFGMEPPEATGLSPEVRQLADDRKKKIEAIKLHREQTGLSLKEAKDAVEAYMDK